jgi:hypothetical protein
MIGPMPELIAKANQAILEAQFLRREGRSLRFEASVLASRISQTILLSRRVEKDSAGLKTSLDRAFSKP